MTISSDNLLMFPGVDPAFLVTQIHEEQIALCDALEKIADSLPDNLDRQSCLQVARSLPGLMARAHQIEEEVLFPTLRSRRPNVPGLNKTLDRLHYEHLEDDCYAEELFDALMSHGQGNGRPDSEAFGYMLRGFFEGLRRHLAYEDELLLPLCQNEKDDANAV